MESQIKKLQQKYWEGKTSVEEEKLLKNLLVNDSDKSPAGIFFTLINKRKKTKADVVFSMPKTKKRFLWQLSSIAAAIVILIAFAIGYNNYEQNDPYEITDPQQAYEISMQALMFVSTELNKGKVYSSQMEKINEVKQLINK
jgi:hypothetical protein